MALPERGSLQKYFGRFYSNIVGDDEAYGRQPTQEDLDSIWGKFPANTRRFLGFLRELHEAANQERQVDRPTTLEDFMCKDVEQPDIDRAFNIAFTFYGAEGFIPYGSISRGRVLVNREGERLAVEAFRGNNYIAVKVRDATPK